MPAGRRNQRIVFERESATRGSLGVIGPGSWAALGTPRWAAVQLGTSAERRDAAVEQAIQTATFRVLADSLTRSVTAKDRITWRGGPWDITGVAAVSSTAGLFEIEFTATTSRG